MDSIIVAYILLALVLILVVIAFWHTLSMTLSYLNGGAPFVPTPMEKVKRMVRLADIKESDKIADLGSGDGRIVIEALDQGALKGQGYEVVPMLNQVARKKAAHHGERAKFFRKSMWQADISDIDVVFIYQITYAMPNLKYKLKTEMKPGSRVISNGFTIPGWEPEEQDERIYLYRIS